ncbi:13252_t:CDS:2 [Acaulospora colombiana]|uniref:13252_t:CDS:1 n=1 Tax=Acaulospora colombiana TaxID=27376 RepID=A0ACA9LLV6_9GLOM|nr:13252_t:CDS:2 [Acaulospora colombiana]
MASELYFRPYTVYVDLISDIQKFHAELTKTYKSAEHFKYLCGILLDRVEVAYRYSKKVQAKQNDDDFEIFLANDDTYPLFLDLKMSVNEITIFSKEISQTDGVINFSSLDKINERFFQLLSNFSINAKKLDLEIIQEDNVDPERIEKDLLKTKSFLSKNHGITDKDGTTILDGPRNFKTLNSQRKQKIMINPPPTIELDNLDDEPLDLADFGDPLEGSTNLVEKRLNHSENRFVAFKEFSIKRSKDDTLKYLTELIVLKQLEKSPYIIEFYGSVKTSSTIYIVTEWAHHGNLPTRESARKRAQKINMPAIKRTLEKIYEKYKSDRLTVPKILLPTNYDDDLALEPSHLDDYLGLEDAIEEYKKVGGDKIKAFESFKKYAEMGIPAAKYWAGYHIYKESNGNLDIAAAYFNEIADGNDEHASCAQLYYADCLWYGKGVERNCLSAIKYYEKSASNGNLTAMLNYGINLYNGYIIPRDKIRGSEYLKKAADQGYAKAKEFCKRENIL